MKRFRVVVAGCGGMARTWVDYAIKRSDTEIVALVDLYPLTAQSLASQYGLSVPIYDDLREAIVATKANLVFDITVPESHVTITTTALSLGCDVFGEKPMGASMEQAQAMAEAARVAGRHYAVMQNRRYQPEIRAFRDLVQGGVIGTPGAAYADFFLGPHFGGFREAMEHPLILDMAIHTFDQARFILGANPVAVYCKAFNPAGSWYAGSSSAICLFDMSDGSVFCYRGSWSAQGVPTSWEADWRVTGSQGTAVWDGANRLFAEVVDPASEPSFIRDVQRIEPSKTWEGQAGHHGCLDEMFASLIENRPAETDSADNLHSVAMVFAAIESAKREQKVYL
ncbi:MAG: Gfo/Idh/MocA family oxidoreductase [Firmicutes bacterium]|nr:Gfo/Idh/MocA family oxidoreductase [Bacillota bacterium]